MMRTTKVQKFCGNRTYWQGPHTLRGGPGSCIKFSGSYGKCTPACRDYFVKAMRFAEKENKNG